MKLWTKNFTIITVGSIVSLIGSSIAGFALGLLVLDYTGSTFLYALYMVMYNLPKVIMPTICGPFVDKFSRRKTIYTLDFISAICYGGFALLLHMGHFNYGWLIGGCLLLGSIDSIYQVTFSSFYPMLISEGNFTKAYSIQSTLESMTMFLIPVSAVLYNTVGIVPLFLINMASFFIAAICETQIRVEETYVKKEESFGLKQYKKTFAEGMDYLKEEKGLASIILYFAMSSLAGGVFQTLALPYFRNEYTNGEYVYTMVMGGICIGRMLGGGLHYRLKIDPKKKFYVAMLVYAAICVIDGSLLYLPVTVAAVFSFAEGILGVTSYNIRLSATQSYVPHDKKGRFNGMFQMASTVGVLFGELAAGICSLFIGEKLVVTFFMGINLLAVIFIVYRNRKHIKPIYNRQA